MPTDLVVVPIFGPATDADVVLEAAKGAYMKNGVVVIGYDDNGEIDARASMNLTRKDILFMIEVFKMSKLLNSGSFANGE